VTSADITVSQSITRDQRYDQYNKYKQIDKRLSLWAGWSRDVAWWPEKVVGLI